MGENPSTEEKTQGLESEKIQKACMAILTMTMRNKLVAMSLVLIISALVNDNVVEGGFIVETESIKVLSPMSLRSKHDGSIGNFGVPDYGGYIIGSVVYPDKGSFACEAFPGDKPLKAKSPRPSIVLLDRGGTLLSLCFLLLKLLLDC